MGASIGKLLPRAGGKTSWRTKLAQGLHWGRGALALLALLLTAAGPAQAACTGPAWPLQALGGGVWWVAGAPGEASVANRGRVSNLLAVQHAGRLWLLGSGPSPASARTLACQLRQATGQAVTDVVAPWARPELVLGHAGLGGARLWAHERVAQDMQRQCPRCVPRLRQRLGAAQGDLGRAPVRLPRHLVRGTQGRLGPWDWQLLERAPQRAVTVWRLRGQPLAAAWGLLWADGPPDGRDAALATLHAGTAALPAEPALRWLPEQGPWLDGGAPAAHRAYWQQLRNTARAAVQRGEPMPGTPPAWPGLPPAWAAHPRHALNWQHAWREAEDALFSEPRR